MQHTSGQVDKLYTRNNTCRVVVFFYLQTYINKITPLVKRGRPHAVQVRNSIESHNNTPYFLIF